MNFFLEYDFIFNALFASLLSAIACGIVGTYMVVKRLVFMGGGVTHSSFGGIGIAYYLGLNPLFGAFVFSVLSAFSMDYIARRHKIREDSIIGILWSLGMAIGIIFISLTPGYAPNLMSFLFGNVLLVKNSELLLLLSLDVVLILSLLVFYRSIIYAALDGQFARSQGVAVGLINSLVTVVISITIVLNIKIVGIVLLLSLLTLPAVIVNTLTNSYKKITFYSILVALFSSLMGLWIGYMLDISSGATTVLVLGLMLLIVKVFTTFRKSTLN